MTQEQRYKIEENIKNAKKYIWITFEREGVHYFPAAGFDPKLADVSFLQYPHRHIFHFKVKIEVFHNDRDIEFIQFKRWCEHLFVAGILILDNRSCEMISDMLYLSIAEKYPHREVQIDVSEDNENGCSVTYKL
jgi:hypothetical protein